MIDLHSHILPGLDDGASVMDQTLLMLKQLTAAGFHTVYATPHVVEEQSFLRPERIVAAVDAVKSAAAEQEIEIEILAGAEVLIFPDLIKWLQAGQLVTLGNEGKYLLLELPMLSIPAYTDKVFFDLQVNGVTPILAHPERHALLGQDPEHLLAWVNKGILFQLDLRSLTGRYGPDVRHTALNIVRSGLVHFIGSDIHRPSESLIPYEEELSQLHDLMGSEQYHQVTEENPDKVRSGKALQLKGDYRLNWSNKKSWKEKLRAIWS
ncbi:MAG: tyrosine-protein phosphatase [Desulfitobacteriaceae bacterium]